MIRNTYRSRKRSNESIRKILLKTNSSNARINNSNIRNN